MSPASGNSRVAITKFFKAEQASVEGDGWVPVDPEGTARMKILAIDEANLSYDMLLWVAPGSTFGSGRHTHGGETYAYILEGGYALTAFADHSDNDGTTTWYNKGDFLYQPFGQIHIETLGPEGTLLYASIRGSSTIYEGFDEDGNVVMTQSLSDVKQMLKA